jgi:predicted Rdx family selenoprotein
MEILLAVCHVLHCSSPNSVFGAVMCIAQYTQFTYQSMSSSITSSQLEISSSWSQFLAINCSQPPDLIKIHMRMIKIKRLQWQQYQLSSFEGRRQQKWLQYPTGGQDGAVWCRKWCCCWFILSWTVMIIMKMTFNTRIYQVKLKNSVAMILEVAIILIQCWNSKRQFAFPKRMTRWSNLIW